MSFLRQVAKTLGDWFLGEAWVDVLGVAAAAVVVYVVALWIVRTGKKRFLGRNSVFDSLLAFMLGSTLARAINGGAPIVSTAVAGFLLIAIHASFGILAARSRQFGLIVKGGSTTLVRDGKMDSEAMRHHHLTEHDLEEAARRNCVASLDEIELATFERNGEVSVIRKPKAQVLDIQVEEGVQTVRVLVEV